MSSAPPTSDFQLWQPPENWSPEPRTRTTPVYVIWLVAAGVFVLLVVAAVGLAVGTSRHPSRALPRNAADALAWEGEHITVETGIAPDRRGYTFEVSRDRDGDLCEFLTLTSAPGATTGGGGGGGCGSGSPVGFNYSSNGSVDGLTSSDVATVDIELPTGSVSMFTKPLPAEFGRHRYYFGIFAPGTKPLGVVGRATDGSVIARQKAFTH